MRLMPQIHFTLLAVNHLPCFKLSALFAFAFRSVIILLLCYSSRPKEKCVGGAEI